MRQSVQLHYKWRPGYPLHSVVSEYYPKGILVAVHSQKSLRKDKFERMQRYLQQLLEVFVLNPLQKLQRKSHQYLKL